jgi:hypothetical protein
MQPNDVPLLDRSDQTTHLYSANSSASKWDYLPSFHSSLYLQPLYSKTRAITVDHEEKPVEVSEAWWTAQEPEDDGRRDEEKDTRISNMEKEQWWNRVLEKR